MRSRLNSSALTDALNTNKHTAVVHEHAEIEALEWLGSRMAGF